MHRAMLGLVVLLVPAVPALFAVHFGLGEALRLSEKPSEYVGVTYSILAASLFAIVAIIGDPSMLLNGAWRGAWDDAKRIQARLLRLIYLFVLYLLVLGLLVLTEIIDFMGAEDWYPWFGVFAFMIVYTFLWSLWLPFEIKSILIQRLEREIKARRSREQSKESA